MTRQNKIGKSRLPRFLEALIFFWGTGAGPAYDHFAYIWRLCLYFVVYTTIFIAALRPYFPEQAKFTDILLPIDDEI